MKRRERKHMKKGAVGIVLLVCVICYSAGGCREKDRTAGDGVFGPERADTIDLETEDSPLDSGFYGNTGVSGRTPAAETAGGASGETQGSRLIYVHVCGEVKEPGVYGLEEGSRVYQAVEAAGGLTDRKSVV